MIANLLVTLLKNS